MKKWRAVGRTDRSQDFKPRNIASFIGYEQKEDDTDDISSNDVVPIVEDFQLRPAILNVKGKGRRKIQASNTLGK